MSCGAVSFLAKQTVDLEGGFAVRHTGYDEDGNITKNIKR